MLGMPVQIDRYEELSALSARMADAARKGDWDELTNLESLVATLRQRLNEDSPAMPSSIEATSEVARVRGLIQKILEDDAEVRRHTEPWMEQVRLLLAGHLDAWGIARDGVPTDTDAASSGEFRA